MNQFIDFLKEYGLYILTGVVAIVEIILIIVKRKPKSLDDFTLALSEALESVPDLIISVEQPGNGEFKKQAVITNSIRNVAFGLQRKLTDKEKSLISEVVSEYIEIVLSTPTKKEIINEK